MDEEESSHIGEPLISRASGGDSPVDVEAQTSTISHDEAYGDVIGLRRENVLRIGHININGLPESKDDEKNLRFKQAIDDHSMDIIGLSETNRCWHLLEQDHRWRERSKGWWETMQASIAYNIRDGELATPFQPGGTMILSLNESAHRIIASGRDETGLGRWS